MNTDKIYDIIGIGIGPFNLGLAALCKNIDNLDTIFIDKNESFNWHPGLMLPTAKMQVPFYADLVTLADPTSPYSYMNYLKLTGKLFRFAINECYFPYRSEFNDYCQWIAKQLDNLYFGYACKNITYDKKLKTYNVITTNNQTNQTIILRGRHIVIGVGSVPFIPECARGVHHPNIFHSSEYLQNKDVALMKRNITIIGSGQSAAEIFQDLLPHMNNLDSLHWYTRSPRFYAMDYSKFSLELSSPDYINYFFNLDRDKKENILDQQHDLYKGINFSLIDEIYQQLYLLSLNNNNRLPKLFTNCELTEILHAYENKFTLRFTQHETDKTFTHQTDSIILATGYHQQAPVFIEGIRSHINWTDNGNYAVNKNYSVDNHNSIFVQNAEWHTHGFNSADLGLGPYRNAIILNTINPIIFSGIINVDTFQNFSD